jgi:hypothetical protein
MQSPAVLEYQAAGVAKLPGHAAPLNEIVSRSGRGSARHRRAGSSCSCEPSIIGTFPRAWSKRREPLAAAIREVREETLITDLQFGWGEVFTETGPYSRGKVARYYLARTETSAVTLTVIEALGRAEHNEFRWVDYEGPGGWCRRACSPSSTGRGSRSKNEAVLIVGAGFAGLNAAKRLRNVPGVAVTLLDRENHHLFQPLLYQVAMAALSPADIAVPIRSLFAHVRNIRVLKAESSASTSRAGRW